MALVDTPKPDKSKYALAPDGKIDYEVYKGLTGTIEESGLFVNVRIIDTRNRYGHLDFLCVPVAGHGERWAEFKNVLLHADPVAGPAVTAPVSSWHKAVTHWSETKNSTS
jgi:hypothetical protein